MREHAAERLRARMTLPAIAAPMFLVSGVDLVTTACAAGVVGAFPSLNARTVEDFDAMLCAIESRLALHAAPAPYAVNLTPHRTNPRYEPDLECCAAHRVPLVISSLGKPTHIVEVVHAYGGLVFSDVTTLEHARKAADCGVDGLVLVCSGAGGHAGTLTPFAFAPAVRAFFDGVVALAGGVCDGYGIRACEELGADFAYMGTRFVATEESLAPPEYKQMLVDSTAADIVYTPVVSGIWANFLRASLERCGYRIADGAIPPVDVTQEAKAWRDVWSAGHGVELIRDIPSVESLVARLRAEYDAARQGEHV